jgi:UDP-N-acetylmuramate dehydrogenase
MEPWIALKENVSLRPWTSLSVGGPARYFLEARSREEIEQAVEWARKKKVPVFLLGAGTNVLFSDRGFPGLVIRIQTRGVRCRSQGERWVYEVAAGEDWDAFVARAVADGAAGIECLSGIPGTVGATPVQNVGAYGQEVSQTLVELEVLDLREGTVTWIRARDCAFGYRKSIFNTQARGRFGILTLCFSLVPGGPPCVSYPEVERYLARESGSLTLKAVRQAVLALRRAKGMLLVNGGEGFASAGSFFKNPCLSMEEFLLLRDRCLAQGFGAPPAFPLDPDKQKVPAAWLVEKAGFPKGYREGRVGISPKHALALINLGGAKAQDFLSLAQRIQEAVLRRFGVLLEPETVFAGFDWP